MLNAKKIANLHRKKRNLRESWQHQVTAELAKEYAVFSECLKPKNMMKSASGTVAKPGKNVAQKNGLNRTIANQAWENLLWKLGYKTILLKVDPRHTSQKCSECGHRDKGNRNGEKFLCLECDHSDQADKNAAKNILAAGIAAFGGAASLVRST